MRKKGFTLVELLVVISIIALLIAILMPALSKVKTFANQMICGTNLNGIGKAMLLYAPEYQEEFPRSGTSTSTWVGKIANWQALNRNAAFGITNNAGGGVTVSSALYLLIKHAEGNPKMFACKSENSSPWDAAKDGATGNDLTLFWDFGVQPKDNCSYGYHMPCGGSGYMFYLTTSSEGGNAVAADRNPFIPDVADVSKPFTMYNPITNRDTIRAGNSSAHANDGQNVMFTDAHVEFAKSPDVGINQDCIYTAWASATPAVGTIRTGVAPASTTVLPRAREDSYLVNETVGTAPTGPKPPCFLSDTPVWVDGSFVEITKVAAGQTVGQGFTVDKLLVHEGSYDCRDIELTSGNRISVVSSHRFMLASGLWISARDLQSGMTLKTLNGTVGIKSVTLRPELYTGKVYNLNVNNSDQYMVGADAVVVRDY